MITTFNTWGGSAKVNLSLEPACKLALLTNATQSAADMYFSLVFLGDDLMLQLTEICKLFITKVMLFCWPCKSLAILFGRCCKVKE
jgi:hypothetical protein